MCDESSAFAFSPPCGSCSVFEVAHSVYKNALNKCKFIHLRAKHAKHQADNLAKLRQEFLSLLELIAKIFCAVVIARTSEVNGNRHYVLLFYLGDSHVALLLGMTFGGGCHNLGAV